MHIAHVASEMAPLAKVGGLGDVVGSLPAAQQALGDRVTCVLPAYRRVLDRLDLRSAPLVETRYRIAGEEIAGGVIETTHGGVRLLLIRHDDYFDRDGIYDDGRHAWPDNPRRFAWLAGAALTALRRLEPAPEAIFAHDWPLALLPVLLRAHSYPGDPLRHCATIQVIHNMAHQGVFPLDLGRALDLPEHWLDADLLEALGSLNMLKGGILCATKVLTVSPTYAEEIVWPAHGEGLDGALLSRGDDLWGILNGIDTSVWNPRTDPHLPASYDAGNPAGKTRCKRALQEELGLGPRDEAPLFGVVSRIDPQKGHRPDRAGRSVAGRPGGPARAAGVRPAGPARPPARTGADLARVGVDPRTLRRSPGPPHLRRGRFLPDAQPLRALRAGTDGGPALWHTPHRPSHRGAGRYGTRHLRTSRRRKRLSLRHTRCGGPDLGLPASDRSLPAAAG
ncbi:MAG: glycogen/starch synthase [Acidobacteriota bacterium]|nr:glycogen/starch synthase [Acidobacteriota bacterium]